MPLATSDLLLTSARLAEFATALGSNGLATVLSECEAEVNAKVAGRFEQIPTGVLTSWIRSITLYRAYGAAQMKYPAGLKDEYSRIMSELEAIQDRTSSPPSATAGAWGSHKKVPGLMDYLDQ